MKWCISPSTVRGKLCLFKYMIIPFAAIFYVIPAHKIKRDLYISNKFLPLCVGLISHGAVYPAQFLCLVSCYIIYVYFT